MCQAERNFQEGRYISDYSVDADKDNGAANASSLHLQHDDEHLLSLQSESTISPAGHNGFHDVPSKNFTAIASAEPIPFSSELEHTRAYFAVEQAQVAADNGRGFDPADNSKPHIALKNIQQRLRIMCSGSLKITPNDGGGTVVIVIIPDINEMIQELQQES